MSTGTTGATGEGRHGEGLRDEGLHDGGLRDEGLRGDAGRQEGGLRDEGGLGGGGGLRDEGGLGGGGGPRDGGGMRDAPGHQDEGPGRYTREHGDQPGQHDQDPKDSDGVTVLDPTASERLRSRWQEIQAAFVDEPRQAVTGADQLVGEVLDEVSRVFRDQRSELEAEWSGNSEPGTEDLRQALRRYREFFDRLLSL